MRKRPWTRPCACSGRKGYEGAGLTDLTKAMGINRPSMYAAFGNKEALFREVMDRYAKRSQACGCKKEMAAGSSREVAERARCCAGPPIPSPSAALPPDAFGAERAMAVPRPWIRSTGRWRRAVPRWSRYCASALPVAPPTPATCPARRSCLRNGRVRVHGDARHGSAGGERHDSRNAAPRRGCGDVRLEISIGRE